MKRLKQGAAALTGVLLLLSGCSGGVDEYQCVHPETGTLVQQLVEGTGTVSYREEYSVIPTVSAKILSCSIEEGDTVTAGQVLYVLDSGALEDQITQARLSLNSAQASYAQAVDACTDLTVPAHASGTVTEVYVHVGDYVNTGTAIASLVDSANLTLTVPFAAEDAAAMAPGNTAAITFPGQAGTVTGSVERVYDTPTALSGGREGVYVEFAFRNPGAVLSGTAALASVGGAACMEAGTVANATEQSIYATQSGQVASLPIQAGTAVTAGQPDQRRNQRLSLGRIGAGQPGPTGGQAGGLHRDGARGRHGAGAPVQDRRLRGGGHLPGHPSPAGFPVCLCGD